MDSLNGSSEAWFKLWTNQGEPKLTKTKRMLIQLFSTCPYRTAEKRQKVSSEDRRKGCRNFLRRKRTWSLTSSSNPPKYRSLLPIKTEHLSSAARAWSTNTIAQVAVHPMSGKRKTPSSIVRKNMGGSKRIARFTNIWIRVKHGKTSLGFSRCSTLTLTKCNCRSTQSGKIRKSSGAQTTG